RILIADDHSVVRQGISILLKESITDVDITHCGTFNEVVATLNASTFDLIILDISIPEGKGVQMIEQIRSVASNIMILIFSAYEEETYGVRYLRGGANGYVNKLSSDEEFKSAISAMQNKQRYFDRDTIERAAQEAGGKQ